jgi:hypothetical protein
LQAQQSAPHSKAPRVQPEPVAPEAREAGADGEVPVVEAPKPKPKLVGSEDSEAGDTKDKEEEEERDPRKRNAASKEKAKVKAKKRKRSATPESSNKASSDAEESSSDKPKKKKTKRSKSNAGAKKSRGKAAKTKAAEDIAEVFKCKGTILNLTEGDTQRRDRLRHIEKHHYLCTIHMQSVNSLPAGVRKDGQCREEDPHQVMKLCVCLNINPYHNSGYSYYATNDYGTCISECLCFMSSVYSICVSTVHVRFVHPGIPQRSAIASQPKKTSSRRSSN